MVKLKNNNNVFGIRTRDLSDCSGVHDDNYINVHKKWHRLFFYYFRHFKIQKNVTIVLFIKNLI